MTTATPVTVSIKSMKRTDLPWPLPEELVIIGVDTTHKKGEHPLWDERAFIAPPEWLILSIIQNGIGQNVTVNKNAGAFELVNGRKRVLAAREANRRFIAQGSDLRIRVPIQLFSGDEKALISAMVRFNEHSIDDHILIKAAKAVRMESYGNSKKEIAEAFHRHPSVITQWFKLNGLHDLIKAAIYDEKISIDGALQLADLKREDQPGVLKGLLEAPVAAQAPVNGHTEGPIPSGEEICNPGPNPFLNGVTEISQDPAPKAPGKVKRPTAAEIKERVAESTGKDSKRVITISEMRKLVAGVDSGKIKELDGEFFVALQTILGEYKPNKIKGLTAALKSIRGEE